MGAPHMDGYSEHFVGLTAGFCGAVVLGVEKEPDAEMRKDETLAFRGDAY